jgi:hypothetical protein
VIAKADAIMNGEHVGFFSPLSTLKRAGVPQSLPESGQHTKLEEHDAVKEIL